MPPERQHNACAAEAAVEEVTTAVNKLHAEVEVRPACNHPSF